MTTRLIISIGVVSALAYGAVVSLMAAVPNGSLLGIIGAAALAVVAAAAVFILAYAVVRIERAGNMSGGVRGR